MKIWLKVGQVFLVIAFIVATVGAVISGGILIIEQIHNTTLGVFIVCAIIAFVGFCVVLGEEF